MNEEIKVTKNKCRQETRKRKNKKICGQDKRMIFLRMKKGKEEKTFLRQYYEKEQGMVKIENIKWKWNREIERLKQRKDKERLKRNIERNTRKQVKEDNERGKEKKEIRKYWEK